MANSIIAQNADVYTKKVVTFSTGKVPNQGLRFEAGIFITEMLINNKRTNLK